MRQQRKELTNIQRDLLILAGSISLVLGVIGIVIPLLPTTPFLLLSATLFFRSSDRLYQWLMNHPLFGEYIRNYYEKKAIPLSTKVFALTLLWGTILYAVFWLLEVLVLQIVLLAIAAGVSFHILKIKTLK